MDLATWLSQSLGLGYPHESIRCRYELLVLDGGLKLGGKLNEYEAHQPVLRRR